MNKKKLILYSKTATGEATLPDVEDSQMAIVPTPPPPKSKTSQAHLLHPMVAPNLFY